MPLTIQSIQNIYSATMQNDPSSMKENTDQSQTSQKVQEKVLFPVQYVMRTNAVQVMHVCLWTVIKDSSFKFVFPFVRSGKTKNLQTDQTSKQITLYKSFAHVIKYALFKIFAKSS